MSIFLATGLTLANAVWAAHTGDPVLCFATLVGVAWVMLEGYSHVRSRR